MDSTIDKIYGDYRTLPVIKMQLEEDARHKRHIEHVIGELQEIFYDKEEDYNNLSIFIEHMPFGNRSWTTLLWMKAHRLCSVIHRGAFNFDSVNDIVLDLIVYGMAFLAWRRMINEDVEKTPFSTDSSEPVENPAEEEEEESIREHLTPQEAANLYDLLLRGPK